MPAADHICWTVSRNNVVVTRLPKSAAHDQTVQLGHEYVSRQTDMSCARMGQTHHPPRTKGHLVWGGAVHHN